jgi:hypothetical protein
MSTDNKTQHFHGHIAQDREFNTLEERLEIDADMLMDNLNMNAQLGQGMLLSANEVAFLYRACQVFKRH